MILPAKNSEINIHSLTTFFFTSFGSLELFPTRTWYMYSAKREILTSTKYSAKSAKHNDNNNNNLTILKKKVTNAASSKNFQPRETQGFECFISSWCNTVRNLGVLFDQTLSFGEHVNKLCKSSHYHLRNIRKDQKISKWKFYWDFSPCICVIKAGLL